MAEENVQEQQRVIQADAGEENYFVYFDYRNRQGREGID